MYVVTFYSFKGGVGRSMSLVNVGVQLAQSGRKVLLVDFDLEAPGLPTFSLKKPVEDIPGIVEYVSQYIATGESPNVTDFVYESEKFKGGGELWVMPVGKQDASYSYRLNSIDWRKLYSEQSGYLFMEDLKRQWAENIAPDYVLIDSRTGHSDVEGICTRQLPNAVCLLFFPNEQNLNGLKRIVSNINTDNAQSKDRKVKVHFVVSNVPDLDDEDQILGNTMDKFKRELGYRELSAEIHHYNSLSLLNQEIFSSSRPNSRLAKEYRNLTKSITKHNFEDREAAIAFLKSAHRDIQDVMDGDGPNALEEKVQRILKNFPQDGEISFRVALVYELLGNSNDALSMLSTDTIEQNFATAPMYATRARLSHRLGHSTDAVRDLNEMLDADGADLESFLLVVPIMEQLAPHIFDQIPNSNAFQSLSKKDQRFLGFRFEGNKNQLKASVSIMRKLRIENANDGELPPEYFDHELAIASIGIGDFNTAIEILNPSGGVITSLRIDEVFNLAMAMWGRDKVPPLDLFNNVIMQHSGQTISPDLGANYLECIAISYAILGNIDSAKLAINASRKAVEVGTAREFSAWSYSKVPPQVFLSHLNEIEKFSNGEKIYPRFMGENVQTG